MLQARDDTYNQAKPTPHSTRDNGLGARYRMRVEAQHVRFAGHNENRVQTQRCCQISARKRGTTTALKA